MPEPTISRLSVTRLDFSDETSVPVHTSGVVLIVGPNNSGKSRSLADLRHAIGSLTAGGVVIKAVETEWIKPEEVERWADQSFAHTNYGSGKRYQTPSGSMTLESLQERILRGDVAGLISPLVLFADGTSRLNAGNSYSLNDTMGEPSDAPLYKMLRSVRLEHQLDSQARAAFQTGALVDRHMINASVCIRIGDRPEDDFVEHVPTDAYLEELRSIPTLDEQGDGMRAYIGLLLHVIAGKAEVIIIDELEAFLHPPQARRLARVLSDRTDTQQLFVATHSADFLRGALQGAGHISVIRLLRRGSTSHAAALDAVTIKELWADPLLRFSSILEGLFHDAVVLCESDADCTYYSAVMENMFRDQVDDVGLDLLFTQSSTKDRFATVVRALRAVRVPVVAVADIDILRDKPKLIQLVAAFGHDFGAFARDYVIATNGLDARQPLRRDMTKDLIIEKLDATDEDVLNAKQTQEIRELLKTDSAWDRIKQAGVAALPSGDQTNAFHSLIRKLRDIGLLVVPVGELERFVPEVGGHGPAWITKVLECGHHLKPSDSAASFVRSIRDAAEASVTVSVQPGPANQGC